MYGDKKGLSSIIDEIRSALKHYCQRQELVAHVLENELGINLQLLAHWTVGAWAWTEQDSHKWPEEINQLQRQEQNHMPTRCMPVPQWGHCGPNQEWEYYLHGKGCRLTNKQTGEEIDWNAPEVGVLDTHFFLYHLKSQVKNKTSHLPEIARLLEEKEQDFDELVIKLLDELVQQGQILQNGKIVLT